ncbi:PqqD family protein [Parerythrobacter aestuarii]|uniref:PqqD family protein n=1 Tax=Parerythrobacter aestuarii TaxID=3020909 RepID=UPI0024DE726D|nr:PqqD family protein [Parerythrobacter aestuarii]
MTKPPTPPAPDTLLQRNPHLEAVEMDGQTVMMDTREGCYFALDEVGGAVWTLLERPNSLKTAIDHVASRFDSPDREELENDIEAFLTDLLRRGLIERVA